MSAFAMRLKQARKAAGLSQERLGVLAGIDEMSASARMNQYERGKHEPDFAMVSRLAKVLRLPVSFFYSEDEAEAKLIAAYHRLDAPQKMALLAHTLALAGIADSELF
ncbi:helix-turn-helix domain-containing protein [Paraburkholderia bryophila]|uniref:helix-turn-helix domain-containing protein n=1 Tax=Paraburkholderia bryophila TaxID=420952 RepID=UPI0023490E66|nr:helix-turn-helix transcriptional regulator [Paraburkholderia bryophila]WCM18716.1 helix-turn-helix domain-containing protein [Paraburkholderia bryophila]